jgi:RNA polymerase sigma factor (sigma-70 family)
MSVTSRSPVHRVRALLGTADLEPLSDSELLRRFAETRDDAAFAALVRRHTLLVLGTARRVCPSHADAEDVFQAAFVTLTRKAGSIRCDGSLAPWLHRVTFRLALRARRLAKPLPPAPTPNPGDDPLAVLSGRELCSLIDGEISRLSARLRGPIVLCCLQGRTRDEAAADLGWSVATLKRRLARAREVLEARLRKKGLCVPAALGPAILAIPSGEATAHTFNPVVSPRVAALCAQTGMAKAWVALAVSACVVGVGLVLGLGPSGSTPPTSPKTPGEPSPEVVEAPKEPLPNGAVARLGTSAFRHDDWVTDATWSPDGSNIASFVDRTVIIWDAKSGRERARATLTETDLKQLLVSAGDHPTCVTGVRWSTDGKLLFLTLSNQYSLLWTWDADSSKLEFRQAYEDLPATASRDVQFADSTTAIFVRGPTRSSIGLQSKQPHKHFGQRAGRTYGRLAVCPTARISAVATHGALERIQIYPIPQTEEATHEIEFSAAKLAFNAGGDVLAALGPAEEKPKVIEVWDARTWKSRVRIAYPGETSSDVRAFALSPDGNTVVAGGGDKMLYWFDTRTGKELRRIGPAEIYFNRAAFRPDGKVLMTVSHENHIRLWDVETGKELPHPAGLPWGVSGLALTPDGKTALVVSERNLCCFDLASGRERWRKFGDVDAMGHVVVTPDGRTAVTGAGGGKVTFWDVATGAKKSQMDNPRASVNHLAVSPDGRTLAAIGSESPRDREIRRWEIETGKPLPTLKLPERAVLYSNHGLHFTPDGSGLAVASGTDLFVQVVNGSTGDVQTPFGKTDGGLNWMAYSPDGRTVAATSGNSLFLWEAATGKDRLKCSNIGYLTCFAFSPDGRFIAVGNHGRTTLSSRGKSIALDDHKVVVRILDAFTGQEVHRFAGHTGGVRRIAWSADGRRVISASDDSSCLVWDTSVFTNGQATVLREPADAGKLWDHLSAPTATTAYEAIGRLMVSPEVAVEQARRRLTPVSPVDSAAVARQIGQLDSPRFAVREAAAAELAKFGEGAAGQLRRALTGTISAEARERLEKILAGWGDDHHRLVLGRGLEVLERIGTPEAKKLLTELAGGADGAWLTEQAAASLKRIDATP